MRDNSRQEIPSTKHEMPLNDIKCQLLCVLSAARTIWIT